jgi:hypothetical protein
MDKDSFGTPSGISGHLDNLSGLSHNTVRILDGKRPFIVEIPGGFFDVYILNDFCCTVDCRHYTVVHTPLLPIILTRKTTSD